MRKFKLKMIFLHRWILLDHLIHVCDLSKKKYTKHVFKFCLCPSLLVVCDSVLMNGARARAYFHQRWPQTKCIVTHVYFLLLLLLYTFIFLTKSLYRVSLSHIISNVLTLRILQYCGKTIRVSKLLIKQNVFWNGGKSNLRKNHH